MKFKKITAAAIVLSLTLISSASAANFSDTRGHWAEEVISDLAARGIVSGVSATRFNPDGTVTRAEFLRMALGAAGIDGVEYREGECLDVKSGDWYADTIQSALDCGIIPEAMIENYSVEIVSDDESSRAVFRGAFSADTPITREEMAYIAQAAFQYNIDADKADLLSTPVDLSFADVYAFSSWAIDAVRHAYANSLVTGMEDGTFRPRETATRAQASVIVNNMIRE